MGTRFSTAARRKRVWELRVEGLTTTQIVEKLAEEKPDAKPVSLSTVGNDLTIILSQTKSMTRQLSFDTRSLHMSRLEQAINAIFEDVMKGDLGAGHLFVRLLERQAKLVGADAPAKIDIEHRIRAMARDKGYDEDEALREAEMVYEEERRLTVGSGS